MSLFDLLKEYVWGEKKALRPNLFIDMTGYPNNPQLTQLSDLVPFYHGGATSYYFAEGHSELKHWTDPRTMVPVS